MIRMTILSVRVFLILLFVSSSFSSEGQRTNFRFYQYNKENKLNEELVKSTRKDSLGIYYFATDNGVLSLQNDHFVPLTLSKGKSGYFKELFKRKNGDLLAVSDDAIYKIKTTSLAEAKIDLFIECNTDSSKPKYPKHLFEDSENTLWIADYNNIYRYNGETVEKYRMDEKNMTSSYARSFQFLECDNGNMIVVSQKGWIYKFDSKLNEFVELDFNFNLTIQSSFKIGANEFLLGSSAGVVKISFDSQAKVIKNEVVVKDVIASCFGKISDNKLLLGTWFQGLVELDITDKYTIYPVGGFPYYTVNDIFLDDFGKYWVSTNSGAVVMEKKFFSDQFSTANSEYITSVNLTNEGNVNFAGRTSVFKVVSQKNIESIPFTFEGSLNVFKTLGNITLLGTEQGWLNLFRGDDFLFNLKISDQAVTSIQIASEKIAWVVANKELFKLNLTTGQITSYFDSFRRKRIVQDICLDKNQNLYIGGEYKHSYLFKYDVVKDEVVNVSQPIPFVISEDFWVIDLELDRDTLYMGTSEGLLKYTEKTIDRINLGEITKSEVNSIAFDKQYSLWLTTSIGVVHKSKTDLSLFTPDQGLPSKTFTNRNLVVDSNNTLWVGTSNGIAFAQISDSIQPTPIPIVYLADAEAVLPNQNSTISMRANSMLLLDVVASIYPQKQNEFQFCTTQGSRKITDWKDLSAKNQILISNLKTGDYQICIRGKHEGNYTWSEHRIIQLAVEQVWYLKWYTIASELLLILLLIFVTNEYSKRRTQNNLLALEKIVSDRTIELQEVNENLETANIAKDKFLSIIAHDLRNPFNAIRGFSKILLKDADILSEEEQNELIETIYRSSDDTFKLLESLLQWANVQKGNFKLNLEEFDLKLVMEKNLGLHKSLGLIKGLDVRGKFDSVFVKADKAMIGTVIRNLLSNAIKFSFPNQIIELSSKRINGFVVIQVSDQGIGMTEKQLEQLFKIDTVFTSEGTANESGTGFGLMLCKEFVELNGGEIWAESVKDKGTSFFFSIPKT
jgi:signal transduction histidine kinase/ligand-binding sensor domain-containing protein